MYSQHNLNEAEINKAQTQLWRLLPPMTGSDQLLIWAAALETVAAELRKRAARFVK